MMVFKPRRPPVIWLVPRAIPRNSGWLEQLRGALSTVDTALLFPPLDRGEEVPAVPAHQALLQEVMEGLKRRDCPIPSLFVDERWNVRSSIPWQSWQRVLQRHGLPARQRHSQALSGPLAHSLTCSFWEHALE
jgi:hypothetical protein